MREHTSWIALCVLLVGMASAQPGDESSQPGVRTVKGYLRTSRGFPEPLDRRSQPVPGSPAPGADDDEATWMVGLPGPQQSAVMATMTRASPKTRIMHAVPDADTSSHHWLVRGTRGAMRATLDAHPDLTLALMPDGFKTSPAVDEATSTCADLNSTACDQAVAEKIPYLQTIDGHQLVLLVLIPGASPADLQLLAQQAGLELGWMADRASLAAAGQQQGCLRMPRTNVVNYGLAVTTCTKDVGHVSSWLSSLPSVSWVDLQRQHTVSNLHAGAISQSNAEELSSTPPPDVLARSMHDTYFPLWKAGLDGTGQVVGVVDSGLDMDSCYLWDPDFKDYQNSSSTTYTPFSKNSRLSNLTIFRNDAHRKVVLYAFMSDNSDDTVGHGTHVATTIVGSAYGTQATTDPDLGTGIAPGAKLAMIDAGKAKADGTGDNLINVGDEYSNVWDPLRQAGAHVTSNSWGVGSAEGYAYQQPICYMLDSYSWFAQDTLHVFAAGNGGYDPSFSSTGTTQAPATCKNILSVGATESWLERGIGPKYDNTTATNATVQEPKSWSFEDIPLTFTNVSTTPKSTHDFRGPWDHGILTIQSADQSFKMALDSQATGFAPMLSFNSLMDPIGDRSLPLVMLDPMDACGAVANGTYEEDTILLIRTKLTDGNCTVGTSIRKAIKLKAVGVLLVLEDETRTVQVAVRSIPSLLKAPYMAATVRPSLGKQISTYIKENRRDPRKALRVTWSRDTPTLPPFENIAHFSAYASLVTDDNLGEAVKDADRRFKPDLSAPGYTLAASSDGRYSGVMDSCATTTIWGTSMAAPVAAGAAAIVRQYFMEGFYPDGAPGSSPGFSPSAPLLKAVLISGAAAMKGVSRANHQTLAPPPSPWQGFGRLHLGQSLPLKDAPLGWRMQVLDKPAFTDDGVGHNYSIRVGSEDSPAPLIVTLAWHDFPGFPGATKVGVNDLNLRVEGPLEDPSPRTYWGNDVDGGDPFNNVERVYITDPTPGTYRVYVDSVYLFISGRPQSYALVLLGGLQGQLDSPFNPAMSSPAPPPPPATPEATRRRRRRAAS